MEKEFHSLMSLKSPLWEVRGLQVIFLSILNHSNSIQKHPARVQPLRQIQFLEPPLKAQAAVPVYIGLMVAICCQSDHSTHPIPSAIQTLLIPSALSFSCRAMFADYLLQLIQNHSSHDEQIADQINTVRNIPLCQLLLLIIPLLNIYLIKISVWLLLS